MYILRSKFCLLDALNLCQVHVEFDETRTTENMVSVMLAPPMLEITHYIKY